MAFLRESLLMIFDANCYYSEISVPLTVCGWRCWKPVQLWEALLDSSGLQLTTPVNPQHAVN